MITRVLSAAFCLATLTFLSSPAQSSSTGDPGFVLGSPAQVALGADFSLTLTAPGGYGNFLMASTGQGPTPFGSKTLCLSFPLAFKAVFIMPGSGALTIPCGVPCVDPNVVGFTAYMQFVAFDLADNTQLGVSNQVAVTIVDNNDCSYCTDPGTKPARLTMRYTQDDCGATSNSQSAGSVVCTDFDLLLSSVRIVASDRPNLASPQAKIWFDGPVSTNQNYTLNAATAGQARLGGETYIFVFDDMDNVLQEVSFHTSCSQPLEFGDQYGAHQLRGFVAEAP
jgi:hypothetical protein